MNTVTLVMLFGGITLIYSAVKDIDPRDVIKSTLKGQSPSKPIVTNQNPAPKDDSDARDFLFPNQGFTSP